MQYGTNVPNMMSIYASVAVYFSNYYFQSAGVPPLPHLHKYLNVMRQVKNHI